MRIERFITGPINVNTYIIIQDDLKNCVIIDPGGNFSDLEDYITKNNVKISKILLTHAHYDHIGAVMQIKHLTGADIYIHEDDVNMLNNPRLNLSLFMGGGIIRNEHIVPDAVIHDGDTIKSGQLKLKVIHTPGHTQGSVCYICGNVIFSGDTLFLDSYGRTDFPTGDIREMKNSLKKLFQLSGDYKVLTGHGPETTLLHEKLNNTEE